MMEITWPVRHTYPEIAPRHQYWQQHHDSLPSVESRCFRSGCKCQQMMEIEPSAAMATFASLQDNYEAVTSSTDIDSLISP